VNICLVSRELYPFQKAGIGVYVYNLSKTLAQHGHRVFIVTSKDNQTKYSCTEFGDQNITVLGVDVFSELRLFEEFNFMYSYGVYCVLVKLIEEVTIDIIEFADYFGESFFSVLYKKVTGKLLGIPFVMKLHTPTFECNVHNGLLEPANVMTQQEDFAIQKIDYVYAISDFMKYTIETRLQRDDIEVLYNMIEIFRDNRMDKSDEIIKDRYVLYVGRLEDRKGIDILIKAAVKLLNSVTKNIKFIIIGKDVISGKSYKTVKSEMIEIIPDSLQPYFEWKDPLGHDELKKYYQNALVSVFPSRFEGFGNVCVEAMGMGSPVIVANKTAMIEIIDDGKFGISFENGCVDDLFEKLVHILNNEEDRLKLGELAKERAVYFSPINLYPEQMKFYNKIVEDYRTKEVDKNNPILEAVIIENLNKIQTLIQENQRISDSWEEIANVNEMHVNEIKALNSECNRIIVEWESVVHTVKKET